MLFKSDICPCIPFLCSGYYHLHFCSNSFLKLSWRSKSNCASLEIPSNNSLNLPEPFTKCHSSRSECFFVIFFFAMHLQNFENSVFTWWRYLFAYISTLPRSRSMTIGENVSSKRTQENLKRYEFPPLPVSKEPKLPCCTSSEQIICLIQLLCWTADLVYNFNQPR